MEEISQKNIDGRFACAYLIISNCSPQILRYFKSYLFGRLPAFLG